jgi:hypothetical protein
MWVNGNRNEAKNVNLYRLQLKNLRFNQLVKIHISPVGVGPCIRLLKTPPTAHDLKRDNNLPLSLLNSEGRVLVNLRDLVEA